VLEERLNGLVHLIKPNETPSTPLSLNATPPSGDVAEPLVSYPVETAAELEECIETYRKEMFHYFPVVHIGPEITMARLSICRPFLALVLRTICSKNTSRQVALEAQIRQTLASHMLLLHSKDLDVLLGLLVYASWGQYFICAKPIVSPVIHLAMAAAFELGLTRRIPTEPQAIMLEYGAQGCPKYPTGRISARTMEERRAILGLFLISST
jgi:hypothetical protein